ncbi:patatin-like phospholipase family protein [Paraburkholderia sp. Tr-20389]|uniref:patatin-like phospholipase family protein n=1 Tax=Paraburkholderia sp. Tr-20389 TaxID=2703903 RepID=UPI001981E56B|nr:patatin-like phospholipase family protein [Paraburkholderia sp. Tr-20389]MBN3752005.1 patatin-like phospholipase family protein [Paraburkholderia sp. Tr-20389]
MRSLDDEVKSRRNALGDTSLPPDATRKWGLALSGGGIRSATFSFGLLRALASRKTLLRFDVISTVSGGGYIGAAIGSLFKRASTRGDAEHIQEVIGDGNPTWFLWWLRANGRYLIPRGPRDRAYAFALFLRNLAGIHFELAIIAIALGLVLSAVDLAGWALLDSLGYMFSSRDFFNGLRWIPAWLPVVWFLFPLVAVAGAACSAAYWAVPWVASTPKWPLMWGAVLCGIVVLMRLCYSFGNNSSEVGSDLRNALWWVICGLVVVWLIAVPLAKKCLTKAQHFNELALRVTVARNQLTKRLTQCFQVGGIIIGIGVVDRAAWLFAFEWNGLGEAGISLAIAAAVVRTVLPTLSGFLPRKRGLNGILIVVHLLGYGLTFVLCSWWVSLVQKAVLGALFTGRSLHYMDAVKVMVLIAIPGITYIFVTGRNFQFLNSSSLHSFYKGRLTRSYLGAANEERFKQAGPLGALNSVSVALPTRSVSASVNDVRPGEDFPLDEYAPQKCGGPIHILNVCVNQTTDPRGRLFNQDRRGLPLSVVSGGMMQVAQEGWHPLKGAASLSLGTWVAISGAALAPGLGAMTRGGIAALASFAGLRLGYWWSQAERSNTTATGKSPLLAKSRGILSETFGVFKGTDGPDWFLTDGGHFENTGAYALLAERAEVIVLADCGADPDYSFGDLENLVRKARIDLQADIYFQKRKPIEEAKSMHSVRLEQMYRLARHVVKTAPQELSAFGSLNDLASSASNACLALAKIVYRGEKPAKGILIVVKPNLCDGLPVDLVNFKAENPEFPQQTTADQFFSEAQWESYFLLGQFMGGYLRREFIEELLQDPSAYFENDERSPFDTSDSVTSDSSNGSATTRRLPARLGATAVGTTLGLGAVATIGVSAWQAIDSVRTSHSKQISDERAALKELTDLWTKLPPRYELKPLDATAAQAYGNLAAALARTADTLCPSDEAGWFIKSPLAARISSDTLRGCRALDYTLRTDSCHVLIEAANPDLKGPLPTCLAWEAKKMSSVPPPRYWAYDYSRDARFDAMHPCDPLRAQLVHDEAAHVLTYKVLTDPQSSSSYAGRSDPDVRTCNVPVAERLVQDEGPPTSNAQSAGTTGQPAATLTEPASGAGQQASAPASTGGSPASAYVNHEVHVNAYASSGAATSQPTVQTSAPQEASSPVRIQGSGNQSGSAATEPDVCKGMTVYVQIYGGSQRDEVRAYRDAWRGLGASVPPIEDVLATAQRDGRSSPMPVARTTVRFHDSDSIACAQVLGSVVSHPDWKVEPLSARLKPARRTIEVWIAPPTQVPAD